jgi:hypothetical protein
MINSCIQVDMHICKVLKIVILFDHFNKFISLRLLKIKTASEVAYNLIDNFFYLELRVYYIRKMIESL